jgi:hypothetical protein
MAAKLYRVQTRTDAIQGYAGVLITWTAAGRDAPPAPYADVIEGLGSGDEADLFRRQAVDELFTFEEAEAWVAYLRMHSYESSEVVEQSLPIPENAVALADMPVGGGRSDTARTRGGLSVRLPGVWLLRSTRAFGVVREIVSFRGGTLPWRDRGLDKRPGRPAPTGGGRTGDRAPAVSSP